MVIGEGMSAVAAVEKLGHTEFRWGRKQGVGGKKKGVQVYESFSYDGVEYKLHDCVYMHKEGEAEPYIGKLIKIWQNADKSKEVKVQWFFRPSEISFWLQNHNLDVWENEVLFASGEGVGLTNTNPLETIAGKCNVICISVDGRNPQPSEGQLEMADYVFYRTFDVGSCTISDNMDDKVGGLEVNFVFNRKESEMASGSKIVSRQEEGGGRKTVDKDHTGSIVNKITNEVKDNECQVRVEQRVKSKKYSIKSEDPDGMVARPSKRAKLDTSSKLTKGEVLMKVEKSTGAESEVKKSVLNIAVSEEKTKSSSKEFVTMAKDKRFSEDSSTLGERTSNKPKVQQTENSLVLNKLTKNPISMDKIPPKEVPEEKDKVDENSTRLENGPLNETHDGYISQSLALGKGLSKEKLNQRTCKLTNNSLMMDKGKGVSKEDLDKKVPKLANNNMAKFSEASIDADMKIKERIFEVTRRPDVEKGKWFALPWEERMQSAHMKRMLVLLQNLDPDYTSGEVEDIVWSAFKESCSAKVVQRAAFSSPHSGQAFVIFKTREAAERVISKLNDGCLILSNQRPLVGCMAVLPKFIEKQSSFVGHLFIDKIKLQMQKEMRDALSTSHCSQPNTIEYELAMEWCLLQSQFDFSWKDLYKQQGEDLKKLMASFKSN